MGAQPLAARGTRRVSRALGFEVERVVAFGGTHVLRFRAPGDRHGWYDPRTGEWGWEAEPVMHWTSCGRWSR